MDDVTNDQNARANDKKLTIATMLLASKVNTQSLLSKPPCRDVPIVAIPGSTDYRLRLDFNVLIRPFYGNGGFLADH